MFTPKHMVSTGEAVASDASSHDLVRCGEGGDYDSLPRYKEGTKDGGKQTASAQATNTPNHAVTKPICFHAMLRVLRYGCISAPDRHRLAAIRLM